jgi:hypothetical protein
MTLEARARLVTYETDGGVRATYESDAIILSGSVTYDREREVRRSLSLDIVDRLGVMAPASGSDELATGARLTVDRGEVRGDRTTWTTLGTYEILDARADMGGRISIRGEDPSTTLQRAFGEVVTIGVGVRASDALRHLWEPVLGPTAAWDLDDASMVLRTARTYLEDEDRLGAGVSLMADLSLDVYMSREGVVTLRPYVDPTALPIATTLRQSEGEARAVELSRGTDWRPVNFQVVIGEPVDQPVVRGTASITDPSHIHHESRIGRRAAATYRSAQVATAHQAQTLAQRLLADRCLWRDSIEWSGIPDLTLDAGDVVAVIEPRTRTDAAYRIDRLTLPITTGSMSFTASRVVPLFAP